MRAFEATSARLERVRYIKHKGWSIEGTNRVDIKDSTSIKASEQTLSSLDQ